MSYTPSGTPLEIATAAAVLFLLICIIVFFYYRRLHSKQSSIDYDSPQFQIEALKKRTQDYGVLYSEIQFGQLIGKGSQGEVFKANWRGSTVAVKKIDTRKVSEEIIEEFCQEAEIMRRLRHPALTLFMGVCLEHPQLCIVTEFVTRGSLFDILHDEQSGFTWAKALGIATDIAQGMTYLHAHNPPILHRDLKSLNILCDAAWRARIADLGMARFQDTQAGTMTQCGSPLWMSPEMIRNDPYDEKADVYSFAIVLWELYTKQIPYRDLNLNPSVLVVKVVKEALRPTIPPQCPKAYAELIRSCWHKHAEKRPTFAAILKVLEKLSGDPKILMHKPTAEVELEGEEEEEKEDTENNTNLALQQMGGTGWKIEDKKTVELIGPLHIPQSASPEPSKTGNSRGNAHQLWRGKYRGTNVVVHQYKVQALKGVSATDANGGESPLKLKIWSVMKQLADLRHPNIVLFMGSYIDGDTVGVLEEEVSRGSLTHVLTDPKITLDWNVLFQMLIDIAQGMNYLHLQKPSVVHGDLKTSSVLISNSWHAKISNYGFQDLDDRLANRPAQPSLWNAPELFDNPAAITPASNIYSFALIMWHCMTKKYPYEGRFGPKLRKKILEGFRLPFPASVPEKLKVLIKQCWQTDPNKRPLLSSIVEQLQTIKNEGPPKLKLDASNSHRYRKAKTVFAYRSKDPMTVLKDWGKNIGKAGSWLIAGDDGDLYMCEDAVFQRTYVRAERENEYRKVGEVLAKQMNDAFAIKTEAGSIEQGNAGDYLLQNDKGDQWVVDGKTFVGLYERADMPHTDPTLSGNKNLLASATLAPGMATSSELHSTSISVSVQGTPQQAFLASPESNPPEQPVKYRGNTVVPAPLDSLAAKALSPTPSPSGGSSQSPEKSANSPRKGTKIVIRVRDNSEVPAGAAALAAPVVEPTQPHTPQSGRSSGGHSPRMQDPDDLLAPGMVPDS